MNIQAGDRVTYEFIDGAGEKITKTIIITDNEETFIGNTKILKIERPKYAGVEEKKELLTEEEKEFLRQYIKIIESLNNEEVTIVRKQSSWLILRLKTGLKYQAEVGVKYEIMKDCQEYTLKELGLEED